MRSEFIRVQGIRTLLRSAGVETPREAVLLLHGNPGPSEDWQPVLAALAPLCWAVAPDMPGYGQSDRPKSFDYTVEGYSRFVDVLIRHLGIERVHLVLHDFGGPWGLTWAAENIGRVASVTLVNVGLMPGYRWHTLARIWQTPVIGALFQLATTKRTLKQVLDGNNPKPLPSDFIQRVVDYADAGHRRAVRKLYRSVPDPGAMSMKLIKALASHRLPANVIWGTGDPYIPVRYANLQKDFFDAEVHLMEGCGHWPMIDAPEAFTDRVAAFLKSRLTRSP